MTSFDQPRAFQAKPSPLKKRLFLAAGVGGVLSIAWAIWGKPTPGDDPFYFAGGITALIFSLRFYFMQVMNGTTCLTFTAEGISMADKKSSHAVAWKDLEAIRYRVSKGGHFWEIKPRVGPTLDFYLDGIPHRQSEELREVITSIQLPHVRITPFYDPLDLAA